MSEIPKKSAPLSEQVRAFMETSGQSIPSKPMVPPDKVVRLRVSLVLEEVIELVEACYDLERCTSIREDLRLAKHALECIEPNVDLVEVTDALADIDYVVEGMRHSFGIDGKPIADEVHASNMRKFGPGSWVREDGKRMKPPDWTPPDVATELLNQGWVPEKGETS